MMLLIIAKIVNPAEEWICSLEAMLRRWVVTVLNEIHKISAISLLDLPLATMATISFSRLLSVAEELVILESFSS